MEMESTELESSVLLHPSSPGAAKHGCWSKRLASSEAGGCLASPPEPSRPRPCQQPGHRGAFSAMAESQPRYLCGFTPGSLPRRRLHCFLWHTSHAPHRRDPAQHPGGKEEEQEGRANSTEGFLLGLKAWVV